MTARRHLGRGSINGQLESLICFNLILFSKIFFASSVSCSRYMCRDESLPSGLGPSECCPPARLATKLTMRSHETIRMARTIPHIFKPRCLGHTYTTTYCDRG